MDKVAFIFSGQGSQYPGMCKREYEESVAVRECFNEASELLGYDAADICFGSKTELLGQTRFAQPAIFLASVSQLIVFRCKCLLNPFFVAGHSIGEYAALYCAGALPFRSALELVKARAEYMEREAKLNKGVMFDVKGISTKDVEGIVHDMGRHGVVCISNYNGKDNTVISGEEEIVTKTAEKIIDEGGKVIKLNVSSGFHSQLMHKAAESFSEKTEKMFFSEPEMIVISNLTGAPYTGADNIRKALPQQIVSPVQWYPSLKYIEDNGCVTAIEFGPKKVLKNITNKNTSIEAFSMDDEADASLLEFEYSAKKMRSIIFGEFLKEAVVHENRNTDLSKYNDSVVKPFRAIEEIYNRIKNDDYTITEGDAIASRGYLRSILDYKHIENADTICERVYANVKKGLLCGKDAT